ncbi:glycosyltransferase [Bacillus sp. JJ1764]|uniref:glycosyltransferase n=1 Tax=Bacillus sp. JJ1764 TaxID=3122964 RepID=UPI002FFF17C4
MNITMVVVLYNVNPENCKTFHSLKQTLFSSHEPLKDINIILYDNSPDKHDFTPIGYEGNHISYVHDPRNLGIATAYNYALAQAVANGSKWLLLLDHDTELTADYFEKVLNLPDLPENVAAVVPKIISENTMISPVYTTSLRPLQGDRPKEGLQEQEVMAINSGALLKVDFLQSIKGFNSSFPLDYLDHWLFHQVYAQQRKVWILPVTLEHELSVLDYSRVSLKRYQSILNSEINFYQNYKQDLFPAYKKQLAKRFLKQLLLVKNKQIALYTLRKFFSI